MDLQALSAIPLAGVLANLGATEADRSKEGYRTRRFRLANHLYGVTGSLWRDNATGKGGAGAISLYRHITSASFVEAVHALSRNSPSYQAVTPAPVSSFTSLTPATLPTPDQNVWTRVHDYLVGQRCLDADLIDDLHGAGTVYSSSRGVYANACFRCVGHGVMWRGIAGGRGNVGCAAEAGPFVAGPPDARTVVVTEAPVDALSVLSLARLHRRPEPRVYATGGNFLSVRALVRYLPPVMDGTRVYAGQDADDAGRKQAAELIAVYPSARRLQPRKGKDWNDVLVAARRAG